MAWDSSLRDCRDLPDLPLVGRGEIEGALRAPLSDWSLALPSNRFWAASMFMSQCGVMNSVALNPMPFAADPP